MCFQMKNIYIYIYLSAGDKRQEYHNQSLKFLPKTGRNKYTASWVSHIVEIKHKHKLQ